MYRAYNIYCLVMRAHSLLLKLINNYIHLIPIIYGLQSTASNE